MSVTMHQTFRLDAARSADGITWTDLQDLLNGVQENGWDQHAGGRLDWEVRDGVPIALTLRLTEDEEN